MITFQKAKQIAETEINKYQFEENIPLIIIDEETIEKEYAWIFLYTSKMFWETKDISYAIGGNGPLFISKVDGRISIFPTGLSIEEMINEYEEENKIWNLSLAENIFFDKNKALYFRQTLGLTIDQITDYKNNINKAFQSGSKTRLLIIQAELSIKNIKTNLSQLQLG